MGAGCGASLVSVSSEPSLGETLPEEEETALEVESEEPVRS